jgi:hypothetical protein
VKHAAKLVHISRSPDFRFPLGVIVFAVARVQKVRFAFMTEEKKREKDIKKQQRKRLKKNALIMCHDGKEYWTTQAQFWQWVRESVVIKVSDGPLRGNFIRQHEEYNVVISNTILNIKCPNHLREALMSRRKAYR